MRELDFVFKDFDTFYVGVLTDLVGKYFGRENEQGERGQPCLTPLDD